MEGIINGEDSVFRGLSESSRSIAPRVRQEANEAFPQRGFRFCGPQAPLALLASHGVTEMALLRSFNFSAKKIKNLLFLLFLSGKKNFAFFALENKFKSEKSVPANEIGFRRTGTLFFKL